MLWLYRHRRAGEEVTHASRPGGAAAEEIFIQGEGAVAKLLEAAKMPPLRAQGGVEKLKQIHRWLEEASEANILKP